MPISEVFNQDNMIVMQNFPDNFFDLAIVDPPYGINAPGMKMGENINRKDGCKHKESTATKLKKGRLNAGSGKLKNRALNTMNCEWDAFPPNQSYFDELFRISKNQIIWGGNYFNLRPTRCVICWDKVQPWENFSQWEMAWTSFDKPAPLFRYSNTGGANKETKIHPTQKPIVLYEWLLKKFAKDGNKILDTHMGSQSSRIAAYKMNFDYWGMEIDEQYFNLGNKRFSEAIDQPLFKQPIIEQQSFFNL